MKVQNNAQANHPLLQVNSGRDARLEQVHSLLDNHGVALGQANAQQLAAYRSYGAGMMNDIGMIQGMGGTGFPSPGPDAMACCYGMGDMMMPPPMFDIDGMQQMLWAQQDQMMLMMMMQVQMEQMMFLMMMFMMMGQQGVQPGGPHPAPQPLEPLPVEPGPISPGEPEPVPPGPVEPGPVEPPVTPEQPDTSERDNALRLQAQSRATRIHEAVDGLGTDENALIQVLVGLSNEELQALRSAYQEMFGQNLDDVIRAETSGDFRETLLGLTRPRPDENEQVAPSVVRSDVEALHRAMDGLGTDESTLISILTGRSQKHLEQLKSAYQEAHGRSLAEAVSSETSGDFRTALLAILNAPVRQPDGPRPTPIQPPVQPGPPAPDRPAPSPSPVEPSPEPAPPVRPDAPSPEPAPIQPPSQEPDARQNALRIEAQANATRIHEAVSGVGTTESALIQVLARLNNEQLQALRTAYQEMYGQDLTAVIDGETSGDFGEAITALTRTRPGENEPVSTSVVRSDAEALRGAMDGLGTTESTLTQILTGRSKRHLEQLKQVYQEMHGRNLVDDIRSETSGDYQATLLALLQ